MILFPQFLFLPHIWILFTQPTCLLQFIFNQAVHVILELLLQLTRLVRRVWLSAMVATRKQVLMAMAPWDLSQVGLDEQYASGMAWYTVTDLLAIQVVVCARAFKHKWMFCHWPSNWPMNLQEHLPSISNEDLIEKSKGIGPLISRKIFHRILIITI